VSPDELIKKIRADMAGIPGVVFNVGHVIAHRFDEVLSGVRAQVAIQDLWIQSDYPLPDRTTNPG